MIRKKLLRLKTTKHYECRRCGTNLDRGHTECPECSGAIIAFEL